jgi:hypothetical protein
MARTRIIPETKEQKNPFIADPAFLPHTYPATAGPRVGIHQRTAEITRHNTIAILPLYTLLSVPRNLTKE